MIKLKIVIKNINLCINLPLDSFIFTKDMNRIIEDSSAIVVGCTIIPPKR